MTIKRSKGSQSGSTGEGCANGNTTLLDLPEPRPEEAAYEGIGTATDLIQLRLDGARRRSNQNGEQ